MSFQSICKIFTADEYKCRGEFKVVPALNWSPDCEDIWGGAGCTVSGNINITSGWCGQVQALVALTHSETVLYCPLDMRLGGPQSWRKILLSPLWTQLRFHGYRDCNLVTTPIHCSINWRKTKCNTNSNYSHILHAVILVDTEHFFKLISLDLFECVPVTCSTHRKHMHLLEHSYYS